MSSPQISLVVLARDNLEITQACVDSLRVGTDVDFELIIVDNGSAPHAARWASEAGDLAVLNAENRGFAVGMNQGLAEARGEFVAFVNNDTVFPSGWAGTLLDTARHQPGAGIVAPAVTAAGNQATVRSVPGTELIVFEPFGHLPSGVVYLMGTDVIRRLGGWNESYQVATGEDLDLLFTVWANGLEVILDERVLVEHVSAATRVHIPDMESIRRRNLEQFIDRWRRTEPRPPRLEECSPEAFEANLRHAAAAAIWLQRVLDVRQTVTPNPLTRDQLAPAPLRRRRWGRG